MRLLPHLLLTALLANAALALYEDSPSPVYSQPPQPAPPKPTQDDSSPSPVPSGQPPTTYLTRPTTKPTTPVPAPKPAPKPITPVPNISRKVVCSPNLDFPGFDVYNAPGSPEECFKKSRGDTRVTTFTWTNYNGGTCWFKGAATTWQPSPGAISCRFDGQEMKYVESCDMPGSDIASRPYPSTVAHGNVALLAVNKNKKDCRQHCRENGGCYAVTWSDYNGGTCWIKNSPNVCKTNKNTYSLISLKPWY